MLLLRQTGVDPYTMSTIFLREGEGGPLSHGLDLVPLKLTAKSASMAVVQDEPLNNPHVYVV